MTFFQLDDKFLDHPSMVGLSMSAVGLWVSMIAYANRYLTDGDIPRKALFRVCPQPDADSIVTELVEAGKLVETADGWSVASFLQHNYSRARVEEIRAIRSKAGAVGGRASGQVRGGDEDGKQRGSKLLGKEQAPPVDPSNHIKDVYVDEKEDPRSAAPQRAKPFEADYETWYAAYPRHREKPAGYRAYCAQRRKPGVSAADLLTAAERYAAHHRTEGTVAKFIKLPGSFLNSGWADWLPDGAADAEAKARAEHPTASGPLPPRPSEFRADDGPTDFAAASAKIKALRRSPR